MSFQKLAFPSKNNLLIVGNFASNTGYAWSTITEYFSALAEMFFEVRSRTIICYPEVNGVPEKLLSPGIQIAEFDFFATNVISLYQFIRRNRIKILYLTDRPLFSLKYLACRTAGVRKIVVHDRTSGERDTPRFFKKWLKTGINRYPLMSVDTVIPISDFVKQRLIRSSRFPERRTVTIWNGIDVGKFKPGKDDFVFTKYKIPKDKKIIFAYSRANQYKGIQVLIEAAGIIINKKKRKDLFFLFCGDGPDLQYFRSLITQKNLDHCFLCPGKSNEIQRILRGVTIVVVPSLWQEGFGLSVIEAMATAKVVIGSKVGGILEIIQDSENGYLFPPGDSKVLASKIDTVLNNELLRKNIGNAARKTVEARFNIEDKKKELLQVFKNCASSN